MKKTQEHIFKHWPFYVLLFSGLYFNILRITGLNFENIAGDLGDTRFIIAIVEYNYQWMIGTYGHYWDGFFMVPDKEVISYSDNLLGSLPIYSVFRVLGFDYLNAFQLLIFTSYALNFILTYVCFYKLGARSISAAAGAYIFAFGIGLVGMYNHPQYSLRFAIPVFFLMIQLYLQSVQLRYLLFSALALIFQFYLGVYLGYFLLVCALVYLFSYFCFHFDKLKYYKKYLADGFKVLPLFLLLLPLFYHYYQRNLVTGYYTDYEFYMQTIPRLSSYLKAFEGSAIWAFLNHTPVYSAYPWLHNLFPGFIVLTAIVFAFFLIPKKNKAVLILLLTLIILISFTTYYQGHTLYGYLMKIPGIKAARVVNRIVLLFTFFAAWIICLEIDLLMNKVGKKMAIISLILIFTLILDNYVKTNSVKTFTQNVCKERVYNLEQKVQLSQLENNHKPIAFLNNDTVNSHYHHLDAMLCALKIGRKTINGYSSTCHGSFGKFWRQPDEMGLNFWLTAIKLPTDSIIIIK